MEQLSVVILMNFRGPELLTRNYVSPLYMPDGETVVRSNMTMGQAIEAIAFAHIRANKPDLGDKYNVSRIEFKDGKFVVALPMRSKHRVSD